ncbi:hypothetical protein B0H11DRAFT_2266315 [Mycena galericulata]|nr:hypothetical protein B0H11DRAFT_2266315 [Mycena galericulata]
MSIRGRGAQPEREGDLANGVRVPGWEAEDEGRVAAAASESHGHSHAHTLNHSSAKRPPVSPSSHSASSSRHPPTASSRSRRRAPPGPRPLAGRLPRSLPRAGLVHIPRGLQPIRDLPGLSALPLLLAFSSYAGAGVRCHCTPQPERLAVVLALALALAFAFAL